MRNEHFSVAEQPEPTDEQLADIEHAEVLGVTALTGEEIEALIDREQGQAPHDLVAVEREVGQQPTD